VFRYFDAFAKVAARAIIQGEYRYAPQRHSPGANPEPSKPGLSIDRAWWRLRNGKPGAPR
jgi:hypothetical protein